MNLRDKIAHAAQLLILEINRADREIDEYRRNFFNKEQDKCPKPQPPVQTVTRIFWFSHPPRSPTQILSTCAV